MSVIKFVLSVLNRKEVTDYDARNNFKEVIWNYINVIQQTEDLEIDSSSKSYNHKVFYEKLKVLSERYKNVGDEVVPSHKLDDFLELLQNNMRDFLYDDVESELFNIKKKHYTKLAFDKNVSNVTKSNLQRLKDDMMANLSNKNDYSDLG